MIITITGKAGSWKSTVAKLLAQKLNYEYISIGSMKRKIAEEMWLNIIEFNKLGEKPENQKEFDLKYEDYQKTLALDSKIILESRLGFFCQPNSFKIFISVDDNIAAQRIYWEGRSTDSYKSLEDAYEDTKKRNQEDIDRYQALYQINYQDSKNFDLVIDSSHKTPEQVANEIIAAYQKKLGIVNP